MRCGVDHIAEAAALRAEVERETLANENVTALLTRANAEVERLTRERDEMKRCADSAETRWEEVAKLALERERLVFASEARAEKAERERDEAISDYSREYDKHVAFAAESAGLREALLGLVRWGANGHDVKDLDPWRAASAALSEGAKGTT